MGTRNIRLKGRLKRYTIVPLWLTVLFAALDVLMYFVNIEAGLLGSVFTAVYFIVMLVLTRRTRKVFVNELVSFATNYSNVQHKLMDESELPYALTDGRGSLLWMNKKFEEISGKGNNYHKSISAVIPQLTREFLEKHENADISSAVGDSIFKVKINRLDFSEMIDYDAPIEAESGDQSFYMVYLFDETELESLRMENQEMQLVAGLVYIDNYEEVLDTVEEVKKSLLVALVDRKVSRYFANYDGLVKKTEKDKYFVVFRHKYLEQMENEKFSLLEDVKTIKSGNEMAITLSIGLGFTGNDYNKNYENARMAIDLALGRGGDQAVIKLKDKITYFGGSGQQVDKTTRVKARVKALALRELMITREQFLVMGHKIADVDSFGAAIGIYCAARQLGKRAQIVIEDVNTTLRPIKDSFTVEAGYPQDMFISGAQALDILDSNTAVIVVDTNRPSHTECPALLNHAKTIVVFDHHRQNEDIIKNPVLAYIEPYASSACEMIAEVLQYFDEDIKLNSTEADAIYAGILIDTNNFVTKTGVRTFEAAAYLRRCGAEVTRVRKKLRNDMAAYKARAEAVRRAEVYKGVFAISQCPADNIESPTVACAQAADELLNIIGMRASFVFTEYKDKIYVSARSIDDINVQLIMERLGGGGHISSAGAQLTGCSMDAAKKKVISTIDDMIREGDIKL